MKCLVCGNEKFHHYSMYRVTELVSLTIESSKVIVTAEDIVDTLPVEHINEFKCTSCGSVHAIGKENGEEVLTLLE